MQHYLSIKGYVFLFLCMNFGMVITAGLGLTLLSGLGTDVSPWLTAGVRALILIAAAYILAQRFAVIEKRSPTPTERDRIVLYCFLTAAIPALLRALSLIAGSMAPEKAQAAKAVEALEAAMIIAPVSLAAGLIALVLFFGPMARPIKNT